LRVGVDNLRFQRIGGAGGRVERLATPRPASAVDLVLHRLTQAQALAALSAHAAERAQADEFAGAVLVARHGKVLLKDAWGRAARKAGVANTPATRFRIGSMNKMFTAVATLQLVEAGKLALDDPTIRTSRWRPRSPCGTCSPTPGGPVTSSARSSTSIAFSCASTATT
jgi:CubicO group peptidase (beta-lactamase class C family)